MNWQERTFLAKSLDIPASFLFILKVAEPDGFLENKKDKIYGKM